TSQFEVGRNIAVTPGAGVLRTEVLELIQYRPQTDRVREIPLLVVPPTINKSYALDLAPGRSLIEYLVRGDQQVFVVSWRNPDARHAGWGLDTYVEEVLGALDAVHRVSGAGQAALMGACAGGIIASVTAARLAAAGQRDRLCPLPPPLPGARPAPAGPGGGGGGARPPPGAPAGAWAPPRPGAD